LEELKLFGYVVVVVLTFLGGNLRYEVFNDMLILQKIDEDSELNSSLLKPNI